MRNSKLQSTHLNKTYPAVSGDGAIKWLIKLESELCTATYLSGTDIKRETWFFYKFKHKAGRMWWRRMENKKRWKLVCLCVSKFFFWMLSVCAPLTFIWAVYPKAICPAATEFRLRTADVLCTAAIYRTASSITQCWSSRWIMPICVPLFWECDIEVSHNPIMAAI